MPVLAIAAHIPSSEIGIDYFQATHPESLFTECAHYVELVSNPEQLPQHPATSAIRVAVAQRGVAVVVIPGDVALLATDAKPADLAAARAADGAARPMPSSTRLAAAAERRRAHHPVVRRGLRRRA